MIAEVQALANAVVAQNSAISTTAVALSEVGSQTAALQQQIFAMTQSEDFDIAAITKAVVKLGQLTSAALSAMAKPIPVEMVTAAVNTALTRSGAA